MPGPLIALATGLGIRNAAKYTYKQLQKLITKAQKKKKTKQTEAEKGYRGQGSKRKQENINKRKAESRAQTKARILTNLEKKNAEKRKLLSKLKTDLEISKKEVREAAYKNVNKRKN